MLYPTQRQLLQWQAVPEQAIALAREQLSRIEAMKTACAGLTIEFNYQPWSQQVTCLSGDLDGLRKQANTVPTLANTGYDMSSAPPPGPAVKFNVDPQRVGELAGWLPARDGYLGWKHTSPLTAALTTGLVGAGLGYGLGHLGEKIFYSDDDEQHPENNWRQGRLPRTLAALGGLAGVALPAAWAGTQIANGKSVLSSWPFHRPGAAVTPLPETGHKQATLMPSYSTTNETGLVGPKIPVDAFNRVIWRDPRVADHLTYEQQAAASGLVLGAADISREGPSRSRFVSPLDIGKITAGMGAGYMAGALFGQVAGALMGLPPKTQDLIKNTGMWAGAIKSTLPLLYGH